MNFLLLTAFLGLAGSLLFSTLSYALRIMSRVQLEQSLTAWNRREELDQILRARNELALSSSALRLLANIVVIMTLGMYFNVGFQDTSASGVSQVHYAWINFGLSLLLSTPALLIASVAIPQAWAKYAGESLIAFTWPLIRFVHWLMYPVLVVMNIIDELIRRLAGVSIGDDPDTEAQQVEQEIMAVVSEGTAEGTVNEEQKKMIEGVIGFRDLQVGQIMTPRTEMIALDVNAKLPEVLDKVMKDGLSRVPVYEGSLDTIVGILYAKDLLSALADKTDRPFELRPYMRAPMFVPGTKSLHDLLRELRGQQVHIAVVLDEYGGTSGLVTTEDIIERIIGDIADEYERPKPKEFKRIDERTVDVDARMNITEVNQAFGLHLPEDQDYHTIAGFVISTLGIIPAKGERLEQDGLVITVLESEPRRVNKLRLELPETQEEAPSAITEAAAELREQRYVEPRA